MINDQSEKSDYLADEAKKKNTAVSRIVGNLAASGIGIFAAMLILMGIEYLSSVILERSGRDALPFMFNFQSSENDPLAMQQEWGQDLVVSYTDPHLGYAHDPKSSPILGDVPGFVRYGPSPEREDSLLRIFALGGSTTDALTPLFLDDAAADPEDPYNWPKSLQSQLASVGVQAEVFNGGVAGYSSSQELLKLIRDVLPHKPDLIIALDGVNEIGFIQSVDKTPMVHNYQRQLFLGLKESNRFPIFPNTMKLFSTSDIGDKRVVSGVNWGTPVDKTSAAHWIDNARTSHAIASEFGAKYLCVLQPILGFGTYSASDSEQAALAKRGKPYLATMKSFYEEAKGYTRSYEYCIDLTEAFKSEHHVYLDPRHQNERGVEILALAIISHLEENDLIAFGPRDALWGGFKDKENNIARVAVPAKFIDKFTEAFRVTIPAGGHIRQSDLTPVAPGVEVTASIWLWKNKAADTRGLRMHVLRDGEGPVSGNGIDVPKLGEGPQAFTVAHTFTQAYEATRLQITNPTDQAITFIMAAPSLTRQ